MSMLMSLVSGSLVQGCYGTYLKLNMNRVFEHTGISIALFIRSTIFEGLLYAGHILRRKCKGHYKTVAFKLW